MFTQSAQYLCLAFVLQQQKAVYRQSLNVVKQVGACKEGSQHFPSSMLTNPGHLHRSLDMPTQEPCAEQ